MNRLRHFAAINPSTSQFNRLREDAELTFVPLEAVWADGLNISQRKTKREVATGYTRFVDGDIVVPKITPTFQADRSAIAKGLLGGMAAGSTELHVVRVRHRIDHRYIRYLLSSHLFLNGGEAEMIGVAGHKRVPEDWLRDFHVPVTDFDDQAEIANYLDAETSRIDALIAKKRRMIAALEYKCETLTMEGVTGRLNRINQEPSALHWLDTLGRGWKTAKLSLVARLGTGHTPSRNDPEWWQDCSIPWITTGEVSQMRADRIEYLHSTRESISELGVLNSSAVVHLAGTVVLSRTASAGYSAIMGSAMATSQDFVTWTCGTLLRPRYLLLCLRAMRQDLLGRLAMGSTHKTIYMPDIEGIRIPLPPVNQQDKIVAIVWERLTNIHGTIDACEKQIDLLTEHRQALITAAVTGELKIPTTKAAVAA